MDVEGSEVDILKGGKSLLARDKPVLILEVSRKLLMRYGYSNEDILSELHLRVILFIRFLDLELKIMRS